MERGALYSLAHVCCLSPSFSARWILRVRLLRAGSRTVIQIDTPVLFPVHRSRSRSPAVIKAPCTEAVQEGRACGSCPGLGPGVALQEVKAETRGLLAHALTHA